MEMAYRCLKGKMKQGRIVVITGAPGTGKPRWHLLLQKDRMWKIPAGIREETLDENNTVCYTEHGSY